MKPRPYRSVSPSTVLLMRQIIVGLMIIAFFGMLIISVWFGTRIQAFTLSEVKVTGGETIPHDEVEKIVRSKLDGAYMKLVPRTFAFTYPEEEIISGIREIKRIKNLKVVRSGGTGLVIEFDEYIPHALWCESGEAKDCFFLDDSGYSFSPAPSLSGGSFLRFISVGKGPAEHTQAFATEDYQKIHELVALFAQANWFISTIEIDAAGDAFLTVVEGGEFKVSLKQSAKETVDNLLTILNSEKFSHIKPGNFEYIDLRFGSKVFVNEVTIDTTATSSSEVASNNSSSTSTILDTQTSTPESEPEPETETVAPITIPIVIPINDTEEG